MNQVQMLDSRLLAGKLLEQLYSDNQPVASSATSIEVQHPRDYLLRRGFFRRNAFGAGYSIKGPDGNRNYGNRLSKPREGDTHANEV